MHRFLLNWSHRAASQSAEKYACPLPLFLDLMSHNNACTWITKQLIDRNFAQAAYQMWPVYGSRDESRRESLCEVVGVAMGHPEVLVELED